MKKLLFFGLVMFYCIVLLNRCMSGTFGVEEKIAIENVLSRKIEEIVVKITGDKNVIVMVNTEYNPVIEQEVKKSGSPISGDFTQKTMETYLPGIPIESLQNEILPASNKSFSQAIKLSKFIKSISIVLLVKDTISDEVLATVQKHLPTLLNLNLAGNDSLKIIKASFIEDKEAKITFWKSIIIPRITWFVGLVLLSFFLFGTIGTFLKNIITTLDVFRIRTDTKITTQSDMSVKQANSAQQTEGMSQAKTFDSSLLSTNQHFNFVTRENLNNFIYLLKRELPEVAAMTMTYLDKDFTSIIIEQLPDELRVETLKQMATIKQYSIEEVKKVEERLSKKINYILGGPRHIVDLISTYEPEIREKIISDIENDDAETAKEIQRIMVTFEDLVAMSKEHLYEVYKVIGTHVFSAALKKAPDNIKKRIMDNLSEGAQSMLKQEMDMISDSIPASRIIQTKKSIIKVMKDLESQGVIKIPKRIINSEFGKLKKVLDKK